ncbi:MAG: preprotein translocase subunit SecE [Candidatus Moranbacteria bacterium]|nr:preprotein translocase subunit SecE [Candidatus Moranbacteria bacterium]
MQAILTFLKEARVELSRVNWPTRQEILHYTMLVIVMSLAVAIFLGSLDFLFGLLVEKYLLT